MKKVFFIPSDAMSCGQDGSGGDDSTTTEVGVAGWSQRCLVWGSISSSVGSSDDSPFPFW